LYDLIIELGSTIARHGLSLSALGTALFVLLKQRKVKRLLRKRIPWLLRDDADVVNYEARQIRIESKIDALMSKECVTWHAEKITLSPNTERNLSISSWVERSFVHRVGAYMRKGSIIYSRRKKMKTLLQKYTSTKLQALIVATVMNIVLLVGYLLNLQDIQEKVAEWTPLVNLVVQTILTIAYQWVRASVDKEEIKSSSSDVTIGDSGPAE
jgi:hypothetical protein